MSENSITVLLIEDNPGDARLIREVLEEETSARFKLAHATDLETGLERLAQGGIDVALLDLSLPDSHGNRDVQAGARPLAPRADRRAHRAQGRCGRGPDPARRRPGFPQ